MIHYRSYHYRLTSRSFSSHQLFRITLSTLTGNLTNKEKAKGKSKGREDSKRLNRQMKTDSRKEEKCYNSILTIPTTLCIAYCVSSANRSFLCPLFCHLNEHNIRVLFYCSWNMSECLYLK